MDSQQHSTPDISSIFYQPVGPNRRKRLMWIVGIVFVLCVAAGIYFFVKSRQVNPATSQDYQPWYVTSVGQVSVNGGVGDTYLHIGQVYGSPSKTDSNMYEGSGTFEYQNGEIRVDYEEGRVLWIAKVYQLKHQLVTQAQAENDALKAMPSDAKLVRSYRADANDKVYVYHSSSLVRYFKSSEFADNTGTAHPGTISIAYRYVGTKVAAFGVYVGFVDGSSQ